MNFYQSWLKMEWSLDRFLTKNEKFFSQLYIEQFLYDKVKIFIQENMKATNLRKVNQNEITTS